MSRHTILNKRQVQRREFDPSNINDQEELRHYLNYNRWKNGCPFFESDGYTDIPSMCMNKFSKWSLNPKITVNA